MFMPLALALIAFLTRLPWLSGILYDFDSVAFAFALERFDVSRHSPHPPGYALYVALGKAVQQFDPDPNRALVWLSVLASTVAVPLMYCLGRRLASKTTGLFAALLLLTSPLFWTFGEVAAPYAFGALFSLLTALLTLTGIQGKARGFFLAALATGLGSGFRPEILLVMSPLWLFSMRRLHVKKILLAAAICFSGFLVWFLPTVMLSGGWGPYLEAVRLQSKGIWNQGIAVNLGKVLAYSLWGLGAGALLVPCCFRRRLGLGPWASFLLLWMLPYPLLATLVAFGQPGMLLVFLPPLVLLFSRGLAVRLEQNLEESSIRSSRLEQGTGREAWVGQSIGRATEASGRPGKRVWGWTLMVAILGLNVVVFSGAPLLSARGFLDDRASFMDKVTTEFFLLSGRGIRFTDQVYDQALSAVRRSFPPGETLVLTNFKAWVYARYYLRGYAVHNYFCFYGLKNGKSYYVPEGVFAIPPGIRQIVLLDGDKHSIHFQDALGPYNQSPQITRAVPDAGALEPRVLDVSGKRALVFSPEGFTVH